MFDFSDDIFNPEMLGEFEKLYPGSEQTQSVMCEGIDIDSGKRLVMYNPDHNRLVDTRESTMMPIESTITIRTLNTNSETTYPIISLFGRNSEDGGTGSDGNPLIYALKGTNGWKFRSENDRKKILAQALNVATNLFKQHSFGAVIYTPSTNRLNDKIAEIVSQACPKAVKIPKDLIRKKKSSDVFGSLDDDWIKYVLGHYDPRTKHYSQESPDWQEYIQEQETVLNDLHRRMGPVFTYHALPMVYRKAIPQSAELGDLCEYDSVINDRDIAIIDDTLTTGKTLSDISELVLDTYVPRSITFITMFSAKNGRTIDTTVPTSHWKDNLKK